MAYDFSGRPYFDRFDSKNNWTFVLFNPDVPLQQSELNESQSILHHYVGKFGDSIFKDGDIQSGLDYTRDASNLITLNQGDVYLNGKVRHYDNNESVRITGVGTETIGLKIHSRIITSGDDSRLLDPTSGVDSYFSSGADRYVEDIKLTLNDATAATIYTFKDGELFTRNIDPQFNKVEKVLAQQRYEESGNYKVDGFEIYKEDTPDDESESADTVDVIVDSGLGYVHGYRIDKPSSTRLKIQKSTDLRLAENESAVYNESSQSVRLANTPVEKVHRVSAEVQEPKERVTRDQVGDSVDYLSHNTAFRVDKVWTESSPGTTTKEYVQGEDYVLTDGQTIDWSPGGQEPNGGTSYYVSYRYTRKMVEGTDYKITTSGEGLGKRWFIDMSDTTGAKPINQSVVNIDYSFYLARQDLITLDENGEMHVLQGEPNLKRLVTPPIQNDEFSLELGYVTMLPNSGSVECVSTAITRLTMNSLQKMKTRIDNVEYNQAINALDQDAMEGQNPMTLRSVFSEGFISLDKADITHPDFAVSFSFDDAEATLQFTTSINQPKIVPGMTDAHLWGRLVSAPFNEERTLFQSQASEPMNVNPYNIPNKQGVMKLTPSEDNWIDEERVTVTEQKTKAVTMNRWWRHLGNDKYFTENERAIMNNIQLDAGQSWDNQGRSVADAYRWDRKHGRTGTMLSSGGTRTLEEAVEFIRVRDVKFDVKGLLPYDDNLYLTFDGRRVLITPDTGYSRGTESGTIRADDKGRVKGTFTIPSGVRCGNREVTLKNGVSTSSATYSAHGRKKTVQDIIIRTRVTVNLVDPLAQSFAYDENRIISSLGLYFASKGDKNSNVTIQIREVGDQGFPTKLIYAETVLNATEIKTSNNASVETRVYFDDPVMIEGGKEYAIVVITESDDYTMWIGTRTQPKIDKPSETISGNPYVEGVLFSSSNASSWTIHQNSDMKFGIYTARFNDNATIEFEELEDVEADRIVLMSTYLTPENTGCLWEAKIIFDSDSMDTTFDMLEWEPLANYQDIDLLQLARKIKLRATFKSNRYVSPLMSVSDLTFTTFLTEMTGSYIARAIDMSEAPYNYLRFIYEAFTPRGAKVIPRYSTDNGKTWKTFKASPKTQVSNNEFTRYTYEEKVNSTSTFNKLQVRLDLSTENSFLRPRIRRLMTTTHNE